MRHHGVTPCPWLLYVIQLLSHCCPFFFNTVLNDKTQRLEYDMYKLSLIRKYVCIIIRTLSIYH